jgi:hypothetical protein
VSRYLGIRCLPARGQQSVISVTACSVSDKAPVLKVLALSPVSTTVVCDKFAYSTWGQVYNSL